MDIQQNIDKLTARLGEIEVEAKRLSGSLAALDGEAKRIQGALDVLGTMKGMGVKVVNGENGLEAVSEEEVVDEPPATPSPEKSD